MEWYSTGDLTAQQVISSNRHMHTYTYSTHPVVENTFILVQICTFPLMLLQKEIHNLPILECITSDNIWSRTFTCNGVLLHRAIATFTLVVDVNTFSTTDTHTHTQCHTNTQWVQTNITSSESIRAYFSFIITLMRSVCEYKGAVIFLYVLCSIWVWFLIAFSAINNINHQV